MSYWCLMSKFYKSVYTPVCSRAHGTLLGIVLTTIALFGLGVVFNYKGHLKEYWPCYSVHLLLIDFSVLWAKRHLFSYQLSCSYNMTHCRSSFLEYTAPPLLRLAFSRSLIFKQRIHSTKKIEYSISCYSHPFYRNNAFFAAITHLPRGHFFNHVSHGEHSSKKRPLRSRNEHCRSHSLSSHVLFPTSFSVIQQPSFPILDMMSINLVT